MDDSETNLRSLSSTSGGPTSANGSKHNTKTGPTDAHGWLTYGLVCPGPNVRSLFSGHISSHLWVWQEGGVCGWSSSPRCSRYYNYCWCRRHDRRTGLCTEEARQGNV